MKITFEEILDDCLARIRKGRSVNECLARYPHVRDKLEPLLRTAVSINRAPDISLSKTYKQDLRKKLMTSLSEQPVPVKASFTAVIVTRLQASAHGLTRQVRHGLDTITGILKFPSRKIAEFNTRRRYNAARKYKVKPVASWKAIPSPAYTRKLAVAVSAALVLILLLSGILGRLASPSPISEPENIADAPLTIRLLSGVAEVEGDEGDSGILESNGEQALNIGNRIKTEADSEALITFFEGSSIKLEPQTDITVQRIKGIDGTPHQIIVFQHLGITESTVAQIVEGSRYEIKTEVASILATGTVFITEVDATGLTIVRVIEGTVSVAAYNQEITLIAGYEVTINPWETILTPVETNPVKNDTAPIEENNEMEERNSEQQTGQPEPEQDQDEEVNKGKQPDNTDDKEKENGDKQQQKDGAEEDGNVAENGQDEESDEASENGEEQQQLKEGDDTQTKNWKWDWGWQKYTNKDKTDQQDTDESTGEDKTWKKTGNNRFKDYFDRIFGRKK